MTVTVAGPLRDGLFRESCVDNHSSMEALQRPYRLQTTTAYVARP